MGPSQPKLYRERAISLLQRWYLPFLPASVQEQHRARLRRDAFTRILREKRWGNDHISGGGSSIAYTEVTRQILLKVVVELRVASLLDVACGDFVWMPLVLQQLPEGFEYVGSDIVSELIAQHCQRHAQYEFRVIDFVNGELPRCDLILCRDALQHLPVDDIQQALRNFSRSGANYLLATTHLRRYGWRNARDKRAGQCLDRNLLLEPFNLADPLAIFSEQDPGHKFLGLWKLPLLDAKGNAI